ncbi:MAG: helix-turn-helix transcriptional regulator [Clostridia bacterium]|nr:helix-turn-helix transcriptional regulator [Clostridia bacterium]
MSKEYRSTVSTEIQTNFKNNLEKCISIYEENYYAREENKEAKHTDDEINISIANLVGTTKNSVFRWRSGECFPSIEHLLKLSTIFNITVDELLTERNEYKKFLAQLKEKGFSEDALERIYKEHKAYKPPRLFEDPRDNRLVSVDFFTVINSVIKDKNLMNSFIYYASQISNCLCYSEDFNTYKSEYKKLLIPSSDSKIVCLEFKEVLHKDIQDLISSFINDMKLLEEHFLFDYLNSIFYQYFGQ